MKIDSAPLGAALWIPYFIFVFHIPPAVSLLLDAPWLGADFVFHISYLYFIFHRRFCCFSIPPWLGADFVFHISYSYFIFCGTRAFSISILYPVTPQRPSAGSPCSRQPSVRSMRLAATSGRYRRTTSSRGCSDSRHSSLQAHRSAMPVLPRSWASRSCASW